MRRPFTAILLLIATLWSAIGVEAVDAQRSRFLTRTVFAGAAGPPPGPAPQITKWLIGAAGSRIGNNVLSLSGSNPAFWDRAPLVVGYAGIIDMKVALGNWYAGTQGYDQPGTSVVTVSYAWLERASTGQIVPVTFAGSRSVVLGATPTVPFQAVSDAIPATGWTGPPIAADELFWLSKKGTVATPYALPGGPATENGAGFAGSKSMTFAVASDPGTFDVAGPMPAITGTCTSGAGTCQRYFASLSTALLVRYPSGGSQLAVLAIGDSITDGYGDLTPPGTLISAGGFVSRAQQASASSATGIIPTLMATKFGATAVQASGMSPGGGGYLRSQLHQYANVLFYELATNDFLNGGKTAAQVQSYNEPVFAVARTAGVQKILVNDLQPATASNDNFVSFAGQTPTAPKWASGGDADAYIANQAVWQGAGTINTIVQTRTAVSAANDNHYWLTNGIAAWPTTDGVHPTSNSYPLMAAPLRSALLATSVTNGVAP